MNNGVLGATAACGRDPDVSAHVSALAPSVTGVDACSRSWKVEPEGGGRLFVETCSFRINVFIFEGDNVSPRAANSLRPENASFRVLYCRSGKKYIFTTGGVRLLVVARVFPVISEKDVTKHLGNGAFRATQQMHRSVYFTAGQEKNFVLPLGVSDFGGRASILGISERS